MSKIRTLFRHELYKNKETGETGQNVKLLFCDDESKIKLLNGSITLTGYELPTYYNIPYDMTGEWFNHSKYGWQFKVENYKEIISKTKVGIIAYLSSGVIKGVGEKTAEKIYKQFGNDTLDILDSDISRLLEVKGISESKLRKIRKSYMETRNARDLLTLLKPHGMSTGQAMKVYKAYEDKATEIVKNDPYRLCELKGFGFEIVDKMARSLKADLTSQARVKAAINYCLSMNESSGSCGMSPKNLFYSLKNVLGSPIIDDETLNEVSMKMFYNKEIYVERTYERQGFKEVLVYSKRCCIAETRLAKNIVDFSTAIRPDICTDLDIVKAQEALGVVLHEQQAKAVKESLNSGFSVITGGPGTGKTATLRVLCYIYEIKRKSNIMSFLSPTGRAARRMEESTGYTASTIHSALRIRPDEEIQEETDELEADLIFVDETSMADVYIADRLFEAVHEDAQIVFIGDVDQLPSVGAGKVLSDIIESRVCPVTMLTKIFRQEGDSTIIINSQRTRIGNTNLETGNDFTLIENRTAQEAADAIVADYLEKTREYGLGNVGCLIPTWKGEAGVTMLNQRLQEALNPLQREADEFVIGNERFRLGDLVMQTKNDSDSGMANGDIGIVTRIAKAKEESYIEVTFFGDTQKSMKVRYEAEKLYDIILGYAITIHKSQGSEYPCVLTCFLDSHSIMLDRRLFYTAITRGKKEVKVYGQKSAITKAIMNDGEKRVRHTHLCEKLVFFRKKVTQNPFEKND